MPHFNLAFLGFGNVGQALAKLLIEKRADIESKTNITYSVTGIATGSRGLAINSNGIDLSQALALSMGANPKASISNLNSSENIRQSSTADFNSQDFVQFCGADLLFETIPVNYQSGQPAVDLICTALENGMHVATANKGPVVHAYVELRTLAASKGLKFYFESAVMDGAPVFGLFRETLPAANILGFRGVLNSTTNLILTRMENGESYEEAVSYAQSIGIAETDPSGDVDGWDAAIKVSALATVLMESPTKPQDVDRMGIRDITMEEIQLAKARGKRWKLVCEAQWMDGHLKTTVAPQMVAMDSPLYGVEGTTSIVQIESDVLGKLSLIEENPGPHTTAYGLMADFLNAVRI